MITTPKEEWICRVQDYCLTLKTLAGIEEITEISTKPLFSTAETLIDGFWGHTIRKVGHLFYSGEEDPTTEEVILVAAGLEARVHLERIALNTLHGPLLELLLEADRYLCHSGPSLYFLGEHLYRVALGNTHAQKPVASTWTCWKEDMIQKALGEKYYGES